MVTKYFVCQGKVWKEKSEKRKLVSLVPLNLVVYFSSAKQSLMSRNK